ncbi:hypothetical protein [Mycolicibacter sinensis]|uniref:hypothetical protein n=1 Tax=Mycolicibacter sinensis (strain JDM601) TaxID=875328 RepID=UPI00130100C7|nr:hypothetical protein [Mycolicibacter sinensis]
MTGNPHEEYRRQSAEHFNRPTPKSVQPPPAIFRPSEPPSTGGGGTSQGFQPGISRIDTAADSTATTPLPVSDAPTSSVRAPYPVQSTSARSTPPPQPHLPVSQASGYASTVPPSPSTHKSRDLRPEHVLWALTVFSALASLVSGFGWILIVGVCAYFAWLARTRPILWPPDIEELLVRYRLAQPTGRPIDVPGATGMPAQPMSYIPFRPLTFGEMFGAAAKIVTRNATTLVGIPLFLLGAFMIAFSVVVMIVMGFMMSSLLSMASLGSLESWLMVFVVVFWLLPFVVAFPADALLIGLSVIATDKAVRGERVHLTEVLTAARSRMFAVCRLTAAYYGWFIITDIIVYAVFFAAFTTAGTAALLLLIPINLGIIGLGIMFSLSPIVLVVEGRGVMESFRRAWDLAKASWQRLVGIQLLWMVCVIPILLIPGVLVGLALGVLGVLILYTVAFAVLIAYFRTLLMLTYTDLRIRQERYDVELSAAWARNTGAA